MATYASGEWDYPECIGVCVTAATAGCQKSVGGGTMCLLDRGSLRAWRRLRVNRFALELITGVADCELAV